MIPRTLFKPLSHAPFLNNYSFEVKRFVFISMSYNLSHPRHGWHVGDWNDFQVAIQVAPNPDTHRSLVSIEEWGTNVLDRVDWDTLEDVKALAMTLEPFAEFQIFDTNDKSPKSWRPWGWSVKGYDHKYKTEYVSRIWKPEERKITEDYFQTIE